VQGLTLSNQVILIALLVGCSGKPGTLNDPTLRSTSTPLRIQLSPSYARARSFAHNQAQSHQVSGAKDDWVDEYLVHPGSRLYLVTEEDTVRGVFSGIDPASIQSISMRFGEDYQSIPMDKIRKIRVIKDTRIGPFVLGGSALGLGAGWLVGQASTDGSDGLKHLVSFGLSGLFVGTLFDLLAGVDIEYELPAEARWIRASSQTP